MAFCRVVIVVDETHSKTHLPEIDSLKASKLLSAIRSIFLDTWQLRLCVPWRLKQVKASAHAAA
jgi:hypothetical protein